MSEGVAGSGGRRLESLLSRALVAWVVAVQRRYRTVLGATAISTVAVLAYIVFNLGFDTSHRALLSDDLPFWKEYNAFAEVFPIVDEAIFVVIDAETPTRAREATDVLAERLAGDVDMFPQVYVPGGGEFFTRHALLYLDVEELYDLADHLAAVQPMLAELARDHTLPGLVETLDMAIDAAETDADLSENLIPIFDSVSFAARAVIEGHPRPISWTELLLERTLPGDSARRLIVVHPRLNYDRLLPAGEPMRAIRAAAADLGLYPARGVTVRLTGNVALNYEEMVSVARGAVAAILGSFCLVAVILYVAMGSLRLVSSVLVTLLVGLIWTAGFATFAVGQVNVVSIAFAVLFIGLGVDFGIHLGMRYIELLRRGSGHIEALEGTVGGVGGSLVLCAVTTATGFYAFLPTDYEAMVELGLISGTGMPISLIASLTVLPALLTVGEPSRARRSRPAPRWLTVTLIPMAARHVWAVRAAAVLLGAGSLFLIPRLEFDINVARLRDPSMETTQTFEELLADSDNSPWTIDLLSDDLASAVALAAEVRALDVVERAVTLMDYVPEDQEEKLEILADLTFFVPAPASFSAAEPDPPVAEQILALRALRDLLDAPWIVAGDTGRSESARRARRQIELFLARLETIERQEEALQSFEQSLLGSLLDQMLLLWKALEPGTVDLAALPIALKERMVAADGRARVEVLPREDLNDNEALARFVDGVRAVAPQTTGSAVSILEWSRATVRSVREAMALAVIAVALVVFLLWRRIGDVALVMAPLLLALLLTCATMVLIDLPVNFVNIVVMPLLLGIGVDSGIHLVHRHRTAQQADPHSWAGEDLLSTSTAQAVFFSALTTMASFGSLALASHRGIASLGSYLLIGVTYMLLCNLVLLPALIDSRR
jgi:hopanoid biosynthesis associated RND transporter like protein HpnN